MPLPSDWERRPTAFCRAGLTVRLPACQNPLGSLLEMQIPGSFQRSNELGSPGRGECDTGICIKFFFHFEIIPLSQKSCKDSAKDSRISFVPFAQSFLSFHI